MSESISRRAFMRSSAMAAGLLTAAACAPQVVKETVLVEKEIAKEVEKEVTRVVEKVVQEPASKEPVTLRLHMRAGGEQSEAAIYVTRPQEFTEETGIQVQLEPIPGAEYWAKIETLAASGTLGDNIFTTQITWNHSRMVHFGILTPMDDYLDATGISRDEWLPSVLGTCTFGGKIFGLPKVCHPTSAYVWINKTMIEEAGLEVPPTLGATWEQLEDLGVKLSKGPADKREVYGHNPMNNNLFSLVNGVRSFGGWTLNEAGTEILCREEPWKNYIDWNYRAMVSEKWAPQNADQEAGGVVGMFASGRLATFQGGSWHLAPVRAAVGPQNDSSANFVWDVIGLPEGPVFNGWGLSLNAHAPTSQSQHKAEAVALQYALSDARFAYLVANELGMVVGRTNEMDEIGPAKDDPFMQLAFHQHTRGAAYRAGKNLRGGEFEQAMVNTLQQVFLGMREPDASFYDELYAAGQDVLDKPVA